MDYNYFTLVIDRVLDPIAGIDSDPIYGIPAEQKFAGGMSDK